MQNIPSLSRSGGLDKESQRFKQPHVQEQYRTFIDNKLVRVLQLRSNRAEESSAQAQSRVNEQENVLILFRKLREGISAISRRDSFAFEVYETSFYLSILFASQKQTSSVLPHLVDLLSNKPSSSDGVTAVLLLHSLVAHYPSQRSYHDLLDSLSPSSQLRKWVSNLTYALRQNIYADTQDILSTGPSLVSGEKDLVKETINHLIHSLGSQCRERSWQVLRKAYIEWFCQEGSETRSWLQKSLTLDEQEITLDTYLAEKIKAGQVKPKEGVIDRYMICR